MNYFRVSILIISLFISFEQLTFASEWCPGRSGSPTLSWSWTNSPTGCNAIGPAPCDFSVASTLPGDGNDSKTINPSGPSFTCTATLSCAGGVQSSDTLTWSNDKVWTGSCVACTNGGCTNGLCNSGSRAGQAPISGNDCPLAFSCTGADPANGTMCAGDSTGLSGNTAKSTVDSCTATKCEFTCNASYYANGASCSLCNAGNYCPGASSAFLCPANSYCPGGSSNPTACPNGTVSPAGSTNAGACVPAAGMNGWISAGAGSCTIANGSDRCLIPFSWNVNSPEVGGGSQIWRSVENVQVSGGDSGNNVNFNVVYPGRTFFLYNNSKLLSQDSANSDCQSSSAFSGGSCQACQNGGCTNHVCNNGASDPPTCTPPMAPVNGACSGTHYNCSAGTVINQDGSNPANWLWDCQGSGGGSTANCSEAKVAPTGTLTASANNCPVPVGMGSCSVNLTWTTNNPQGLSQVTTNYPVANTVVATANNQGAPGHSVNIVPGANQSFYLYNPGSVPALASVGPITATCAAGGWDSAGTVCADPNTTNVTLTGDYYNNPGVLKFYCTGSDSWEVKNTDTNTIVDSGADNGTGLQQHSVNINGSGNYQVVCKHGNYRDPSPETRYYNAPPPPEANITLNATPVTIIQGGAVTLTWETKFPVAACNLTAKVVCPNNLCNATQTAFQNTLTTALATENTDQNDPSGSRNIQSAVKNLAPGEDTNGKWRALGKKTLTNIKYTADFTYRCSATNAETKRVKVSSSNEG